jgi:hypothetical protein
MALDQFHRKILRAMSISALAVRRRSEAEYDIRRPRKLIQGEHTMKFMLILKSTKDSEAGKMPSEETINAMIKFNQEQAKAGVLVDAAGLWPSSKGARVKISSSGKKTVVDGPFTESKELVAGYWILEVKSLQEAIEWAKRAPETPNQETEIEVREFIAFE